MRDMAEVSTWHNLPTGNFTAGNPVPVAGLRHMLSLNVHAQMYVEFHVPGS